MTKPVWPRKIHGVDLDVVPVEGRQRPHLVALQHTAAARQRGGARRGAA